MVNLIFEEKHTISKLIVFISIFFHGDRWRWNAFIFEESKKGIRMRG